ncbi:ATP-binding cassette domain-containing protein [Sporolactobacillus sp. THM7-4]|nr:ATP-binding cassette domain-containing protein [Sporolactobacillus sp. THM7-4]
MGKDLLQVKDLKVYFSKKSGFLKKKQDEIRAVDKVTLSLKAGETLGIVGESGCGKSTLARTIMGLEKPTSGTVLFEGQDIFSLNRKQMHQLRRDIQMVFQDPFSSLNPRMKVGDIIAAPLKAYGYPNKGIRKKVSELMDLVGIKPEYYDRLPHEFSGGQCQRIGIARAIALKPKLIVCDEPVSALDVSIQAQIINLLKDLQKEFHLTYLFISHDLSVVKNIANRVAVIYLGKVVEFAENESFFNQPFHPYTHMLLSAIPLPDPRAEKARNRIAIKNDFPVNAGSASRGCVFYSRCPIAQDYCREHVPEFVNITADHRAACFYPVKNNSVVGEAPSDPRTSVK